MPARAESRLLLAILAAAAGTLAQAPPHSHAIAAWIPLAEGAAWTYRTSATVVAGLPATESQQTVGVVGSYRARGNRRFLVRTTHGNATLCYEHWQLQADGLAILPSVLACISPADEEAPPRRPLAAPVGGVTEWCWTEPGQQAKESWSWTARVVAYAEMVAVPAGTWPAVHVVAEGDNGSVRESWYVRGVGLVADETRYGSRRARRELLRYAPGADGAPVREGLLHVQLPDDWLYSPNGPARIEWLDEGVESLALPGRFALLDCGGARRCAFVGAAAVVAFDPGDAGAWRRLLADRANPLDPPSRQTLGRLLVRALAHASGQRVGRIDAPDADRTGGRQEQDLTGATGIDFVIAGPDGRSQRAEVALDAGRLKLSLAKR